MTSTSTKPRSSYRQILLDSFERRRSRNGEYSLRAFARDIGLSPSRLSEVMNKGEPLSPSSARKVAKNLGLSGEESRLFRALVDYDHCRSNSVRRGAIAVTISELSRQRDFQTLKNDGVKALTSWQHLAILEALELGDLPSDKTKLETWLAKKLRISLMEVSLALSRLERLNLIRPFSKGYKRTNANLATSHEIPSAAVRDAHDTLLKKATAALHEQAFEQRAFNSLILGVASDRLDEAKGRLHEFCRSFNEEFGTGSERDRVYCLALQFFALSE